MSESLDIKRRRNRNLLIIAAFVAATVSLAGAGFVIYKHSTIQDFSHGKLASLRELADLEQNTPEILMSLPIEHGACWRREEKDYFFQRGWQIYISGRVDLNSLAGRLERHEIPSSTLTAVKPIAGTKIDEQGAIESITLIQTGQNYLMFNVSEKGVYCTIKVNLADGGFLAIMCNAAD